MSINLIWRIDSAIILASDSLTTVRQNNRTFARKTQRVFKLYCHIPLAAVCSGSSIIGELPVAQLLSQNYEQERESIEGYADLIHEEIREAIKHDHSSIETTNFAIHLAGFCPTMNQFQHFLICTERNSLKPPRKLEREIFVGGDVGAGEIEILKEAGLGSVQSANIEQNMEASVDIVRSAMNRILSEDSNKVLEPAQILVIKKDRATWVNGPAIGNIADLA